MTMIALKLVIFSFYSPTFNKKNDDSLQLGWTLEKDYVGKASYHGSLLVVHSLE